VEVPYGEGLANRTGPESCVGRREASGEALTGVRVGRPLSRESVYEVQGADAVQAAEGNTAEGASASAWPTLRGRRPRHARRLLVREPGDLPSGRRPWRAAVRIGKAEEAVADDVRAAEVGLLHSTVEAGEQGACMALRSRWREGGGPRARAVGKARGGHRAAHHAVPGAGCSTPGVFGGGSASRVPACALSTRGRSRMREFRSSGSVRGARGNPCPYRDPF